MSRIFGKSWTRSLLILAALVFSLMLAAHFMIVILERPYVGIYTVKEEDRVIVHSVAPYSWAESSGIKPGDRILAVDGKSPLGNRNVRLFGMVGQAKRLTIDKGGNVFYYTIDNRASKWSLLFYLIIPLAFFSFCFVAALFLYFRREQSSVINTLIAFLLAMAPVLFEIAANARHDRWSLRLTSMAIVFSLIFLIHFLRAYFSACGFLLVSNWLLGCLYLCGSLIVLNSGFLASREVDAYYRQELVFSVFVFILLCIQLARLYYQIRASEYSRIIHLLIAGAFLGLVPFIALYAAPNMFIGTSLVPVEWTTPWMIMLPLTLCYIVMSSALIDTSFYIGRLAYYCALSFGMVLVVLLGTFGPMRRLQESPVKVLQFAAICFVVGLAVLYFMEYTDYRLIKYLHPRQRRRRRMLNRFLREIKTEYTLRHIDMMLRHMILSELPVADAGLLQNDEDGRIRPVNRRQSEPVQMNLDEGQGSGLRTSDRGFLAVIKREANVQIILAGKWIKPGRSLNLDENIWLETLVNYVRVVVDNLYKTEAMMQTFHHMENDRGSVPRAMNRWLFSIAEQERAHLARDIHDTNIQDQLAIARDIEWAAKTVDDPRTARRLAFIRERILDNTDEMRRLIREWYPAEIFRGKLENALTALFDSVALSADFHLVTQLDRVPDKFPEAHTLCVYRAVQELLRNALDHARPSLVRLTLSFADGLCRLRYQDDGSMLHTGAVTSSFSTTGLAGLISRVEGLNGTVTFFVPESGRGQGGLSVFISLPCNEAEVK